MSAMVFADTQKVSPELDPDAESIRIQRRYKGEGSPIQPRSLTPELKEMELEAAEDSPKLVSSPSLDFGGRAGANLANDYAEAETLSPGSPRRSACKRAGAG
jgi:hypothetical protein